MSELVVKISFLSKKRISLALIASFLFSLAATYLYHRSKETLYHYGAEIIVPDKYINDNFYEITRIHESHESFVNYRQLDYEVMARSAKHEIRKEIGITNVNIVGSNGRIKVGAKAKTNEAAKELSQKATIFLLNYWTKHVQGLLEPIEALKEKLKESLKISRLAMSNNELILQSSKSNRIIQSYALEKKVELLRLEGEFLGKLKLVKNILLETKKPFILKESRLIHIFKPSALKTSVVFLLMLFLFLGFSLHFLYLIESKKNNIPK